MRIDAYCKVFDVLSSTEEHRTSNTSRGKPEKAKISEDYKSKSEISANSVVDGGGGDKRYLLSGIQYIELYGRV